MQKIITYSPFMPIGETRYTQAARLWLNQAGRDEDKDKPALVAFALVRAATEDRCRTKPHADLRVGARANREERLFHQKVACRRALPLRLCAEVLPLGLANKLRVQFDIYEIAVIRMLHNMC